ncbi:K+-transporting ATPase ATPase C chain [Chryseolinea serpens]|uniref:Potassium-transporting ATPase KdpC subunit n=1 Tax=Chryseolinea serpens TaxID=947013 RepID=A0A1M5SEX0_9BACT|nr:K(+)-transporting ATPase subunit C [Chryseolinea serpens]SHH36970.1 K+-transporting ATPase ATPase C chain [Chryseolinea serpens]
MKTNIIISLKLTLVLLIITAGLYPLLIAGAGKAAPGGGKGETLSVHGKVVGYERVGQKFTEDKYFWGRPSAVEYNAAGSAGSNKGPSNPDYLATVQARIDTFLVHNPGIAKEQIPADLVTASGSGLDPDISPEAARIQIARIARVRNLGADKLEALVNAHIEGPFLGMFGPSKVHVLKLNMALDELK